MATSSKQKQQLIPAEMLARRNALRAEVDANRAALADAERGVEEAFAGENAIARKHGGGLLHDGHPLREAGRKLRCALSERDMLRNQLRNAERELARIEATIGAPMRLADAANELDAATTARTSVEEALADVVSRQAAMPAKDSDLAARIADIDTANGIAIAAGRSPDLTASVHAEAERRAVCSALAKLAEQAASLSAQREQQVIRQQAAREAMREASTTVAELELAAALRPVLPLMAKMLMMRREDPRRMEIEIPQDVIDSVEAEITNGAI